MKLMIIIDSLELNGGSTMFLEMIRGFRKYYPEHPVEPMVVSKTGEYGRKKLVSPALMQSYGCGIIPSMTYEDFYKNIRPSEDTVILQNRLECTRPLKVHSPYIAINHTVQKPHRMEQFQHADAVISVCNRIKKTSKKFIKSKVVLNGIENNFISDVTPNRRKGTFITGRCHRLHVAKFLTDSVPFLKSLPIKGHQHYIAGPHKKKTTGNVHFLDSIFDRQEKISTIKGFDVYFYDTVIKEGASAAILESLACGVPVVCKPLGGNSELVIHGKNGFLYKNYKQAKNILIELSEKPDKLKQIQKQVKKDFNSRLHIKNMLRKYIEIVNEVVS